MKKASKSKKDAEQVLNQIDNLEQKLNESDKDIVSISDSDVRLMINKKGRWEFCYNYQIGVDAENGLIVSTGLTQNPADFNELQPQIEKLESIVGPLAPNTQILADNGYSTDEATDFLEQKSLDGYIASRKLARKDKNLINVDNHSLRTISLILWKNEPISVLLDKYWKTRTNIKYGKISEKSFTGLIIAKIVRNSWNVLENIVIGQ